MISVRWRIRHSLPKTKAVSIRTASYRSTKARKSLSIDGVKIAEKAMLPKAIIDFIRTHHGRGKAKYFYNSFKNQYPDREIDEEAFTYPGPNPFSKETAVLMMADSVEAASRSLKEHTEENIRALVDKIIDGQIADGLMRNAPLTFKDVETVKNVFVEKLKIMYHTRISYPDLKK